MALIDPGRILLERIYSERRLRNPSYSLRAFSRDLEISPATLSQVLSAKRTLSKQSVLKVADRLCLTPSETKELLSTSGRRASHKTEREILDDDVFRVISDWYHFAILSLARTKNCRANPAWVGKRLGISAAQARSALLTLEKMKLVEVKGKNLLRTSNPITTTQDIPSSALRKFHKQHLELASQSLEKVPTEKRDVSTITMAIDPKNIDRAKRMIAKMRDRISKVLETGKITEVYTMAIQLFPLTCMMLVLCSFVARAGDVGGNGGDIVICDESPGDAPELLDYFEGRVKGGIYSLGGNQRTPLENVHIVLERLSRFDAPRAALYAKEADSFESNVQWVNDGPPLEDIPDAGDVTIPPECAIHQWAIRQPVFHSSVKPFLVDERIWKRPDVSSVQRAGLILHEVIYGETKRLGHNDSITARKFNSVISSDEFPKISSRVYAELTQEVFKWLRELKLRTNPIEFGVRPGYIVEKKLRPLLEDPSQDGITWTLVGKYPPWVKIVDETLLASPTKEDKVDGVEFNFVANDGHSSVLALVKIRASVSVER